MIEQLATFQGHSKPPSKASRDSLQGVSRIKNEAVIDSGLEQGSFGAFEDALLL